jgi:hypothetical protein
MAVWTPINVDDTVTGLAGSAGTSFYYTLVVEAGAAYRVTLTDTAASGADVDLVYAFDREFEYNDEDGGSYSGSADEEFVYFADNAGTLYIVVYGYDGAFTSLELTVALTAFTARAESKHLALRFNNAYQTGDALVSTVRLLSSYGVWYGYAKFGGYTWFYTSADGEEWQRHDPPLLTFNGSTNDMFLTGDGRYYIDAYHISGTRLYETTDFNEFVVRTRPFSGAIRLEERGGTLYAFDPATRIMYTSIDSAVSWTAHATDLPAISIGSQTAVVLRNAGGTFVLLGGAYGTGPYTSRVYRSSDGFAWSLVGSGFYLSSSLLQRHNVRGDTVFGWTPAPDNKVYLSALDAPTGVVTIYDDTPLVALGDLCATADYVVTTNVVIDAAFVVMARSNTGVWAQLPPTGFSNNAVGVAGSYNSNVLLRTADFFYNAGVLTGNAVITPLENPTAQTVLAFTATRAVADYADDEYVYFNQNSGVARAYKNTGVFRDMFSVGSGYLIAHVGAAEFVLLNPTTSMRTLYNARTGASFTSPCTGLTATSLSQMLVVGSALVAYDSENVNVSFDKGGAWIDATAAFDLPAGGSWTSTLRCEQSVVYYHDAASSTFRILAADFSSGFDAAAAGQQAAYNATTNRVGYLQNGMFSYSDAATGALLSTYRLPLGLTNGGTPWLYAFRNGFLTFELAGPDGVRTAAFTIDGSEWAFVTFDPPDRIVDVARTRRLVSSPTALSVDMSTPWYESGLAPFYSFSITPPHAQFVIELPLFWTGFINCEDAT